MRHYDGIEYDLWLEDQAMERLGKCEYLDRVRSKPLTPKQRALMAYLATRPQCKESDIKAQGWRVATIRALVERDYLDPQMTGEYLDTEVYYTLNNAGKRRLAESEPTQ